MLIGLARKASMPAAKHASASPCRALAVTAIIGTVWPAWRIAWVAWKAVHLGHAAVHEYHIDGGVFGHCGNSFTAIFGQGDLESESPDQLARDDLIHLIVFGN